MSEHAFQSIALKSGNFVVGDAKVSQTVAGNLVDQVAKAIQGIATDMPVQFYVADKFKKFGSKEQVAVLANAFPSFPDSGLNPEVAHVVVSGERSVQKAPAPKIADAAVQAVARYTDLVSDNKLGVDDRLSWVAYAALLAISHPALKGLQTTHPVTRKSIPFADRYLSMALGESVSIRELAKGLWNQSIELEKIVNMRKEAQKAPVTLPMSVEALRSACEANAEAANLVPTELAA